MATTAEPAKPLLLAQQASLTREDRIATLDLTAVTSKARVDVADRLTGARVTLTIDGASQLELDIFDPDRSIERSQLLDRDRHGRLDTIAVKIDGLRWRLVKAARNGGDTLTLMFEDEVWALLRAHNKPKAVSRNAVTRAQFVERLVGEIKIRDVPFYAPEKGRKQPRALPDFPDLVPAQDDDKSTKSSYTDITWAAALIESLGIEQSSANMQAIIGWERAEGGHWHNDAKFNPLNTTQAMPGAGNTGSQGNIKVYRSWKQGLEATVKTLRNGNYGPILSALKGDHPQAVATAIDKSPWGTHGPLIYNAIRSAPSDQHDVDGGGVPGGATDDSSSTVVVVKSYRFTRGLPGQVENSAQTILRLADEVNWRFFISGGVAWFVTDRFLLTRKADLILTGYDAPGLIDWPTYEWDHRKLAAEVTLPVAANAWGVRPGEVVILHDMGSPLDGRWIVETFEFDLLDPLAGEVTLTQPTNPKKEPAPEVSTVTKNTSDASDIDDDGAGATGTVLKNTFVGSPIPGQKWHAATHETAGLPGYPANDYMAPAGTPVVAPESGRVFKLSGHDPKLGGSAGGPMGYSIYISAGPRKYFMTHLDKVRVKVDDRVKQGSQIAVVARSGAGTWDNNATHCHQGINGPVPPS